MPSNAHNSTFISHYGIIRLLVLSLLFIGCNDKVETKKVSEISNKYQQKTKASFTGSKTCIPCHQEEYTSWNNSHHQQAMKLADSSSVLGDFNNTLFTSKGIITTFFKKDNEFWVNTEGPDGTNHDYQVFYTFGVYPLQQYLIKFPNGVYQCLLTAWDAKKNVWYDLQPKLQISHKEWLHWSRGSMTWNTMCADCHSTNLMKNFDSQTNTFNTTFSEINVSCEACHGPASLHNEYYQTKNTNQLPPRLEMNTNISSKELVDKCARCHSRRSALTKYYNYKGTFLDHYNPALLTEPTYEKDGQIKDEDYVYGSFIQSKMYHNGVSCIDCHNSHTLELKAEGNKLCLSCHEPNYNEASHHFHQKETKGAQCINCHMVGKMYMGNDYRRDHSFRIPRPDQSVIYGTPNACINCHKDKSNEWASDNIKKNYGKKRPDHFSDYLLKGDKAALHHLFSSKSYPEIARATALKHYSTNALNQNDVNEIINFLNDSSALVRNEAVKTLESLDATSFKQYLEPLLLDKVKLVRISTARSLNKSTNEYLEQLDMNSDFASGQYHIAVNHELNNRPDLAKTAYERSIEIDNYFNASRMNLALLNYKQGNVAEAEKLYLKVIEQEPDFSESYYMLSLLNNEKNKNEEAMHYMKIACSKKTTNYKPFYNYALMLQAINDIKNSIIIIDKGLQVYPNNEQLLYVKLTTQLNQKDYQEARQSVNTLLEINPNNQTYLQISQQLTQTK